MKEALIDPTTQISVVTGWEPNPDPLSKQKYLPVISVIENSARVAEVVPTGSQFPVASPLFWTECSDDVVADQWYYDTLTNEILVKPDAPPYPS